MAYDIIKMLADIQEQVIKARRLASEIGDPETARRLHEMADEIEARAREMDAENCGR